MSSPASATLSPDASAVITPDDGRPTVAMIANSQTPYRLAFHLRIVRELKEVRLLSLYTHEVSNAPWAFAAPPETNPVRFGIGESSEGQDKLSNVIKEWKKGGSIIHFLQQQNVKAVIMLGYNDPGRFRILRWCKKTGIPAFVFGDSNIHADTISGLKAKLKAAYVKKIISYTTGLLPCGTLGVEFFKKYGGDPARMFFMPYEPDYGLLASISADDVHAAVQRYGLTPHRRRVVYCGRLVEAKRVDLLMHAFSSIAQARPDWDMLVIGDGPLRRELQAILPESLRSRVTWTGFLDDQHTISSLYRACDVLVLPSSFEPWAVVVNEAAAAGLALVCSDVVGAGAELVRDNINGRAFKSGNQDSITAALLAVTDLAAIDRLKAGSATVLADWRKRGDPVEGLRKALAFAGVLGTTATGAA